MNQLEKRVARLEQKPTPDSCYILIINHWAPDGGVRLYMIIDEAKVPEDHSRDFFVGPFKSLQDAVTCSLQDLKTRAPEAHERLIKEKTVEQLIEKKQVTALLTAPEYARVTADSAMPLEPEVREPGDAYGLASNR